MKKSFPISGDTFELRELMKQRGCHWDDTSRCWLAPDSITQTELQALADEEPRRKWHEYMESLTWAKGSFTTTVFNAGQNACSRGIGLEEAKRVIEGRVEAAGGKLEPGWIERNVGRAYEYAEPPSNAPRPAPAEEREERKPKPNKPEFMPWRLAEFAGQWAKRVDRLWLADRSPVNPIGLSPHDFLRALYRPEERVVIFDVFKSQGQWLWSSGAGFVPSRMDYAAWDKQDGTHRTEPPTSAGPEFPARGEKGIWYLCNPVDGAFRMIGGNDKWDRPMWSRRWQECVTSWRYFCLESDKADAREWLGAIVQLPLSIAAIYTSAGRSIHVLVKVDALSKAQFDLWRETAKRTMIPLGADPGCMSAVRLTRLPGCLRLADKEGKVYAKPREQRLLYLDPAAGSEPICGRLAVRDAFAPFERWGAALLESAREDVDREDVEGLLGALGEFRSERARDLVERIRRWNESFCGSGN